MALTSRQRNKLPPSAFVIHPKNPKPGEARSAANGYVYPVPTKQQARNAGISESQRQQIHRSAKSYAGRSSTRSNTSTVRAKVNKRR